MLCNRHATLDYELIFLRFINLVVVLLSAYLTWRGSVAAVPEIVENIQLTTSVAGMCETREIKGRHDMMLAWISFSHWSEWAPDAQGNRMSAGGTIWGRRVDVSYAS